MLDVLICHAPGDLAQAEALAARLTECAEARPWLEVCDGERAAIPEVWDRGTAGAAIVLLLSPGSVRKQVLRTEWAGLLEHVEGNEAPPVACVKLADCAYPKILERKRFFSWNGDGFQTLREIERWVVGLHPPAAERLDLAPIPGFSGREFEMDALFAALVDAPGQAILLNPEPGSGKTALAQEFARRASRHFREIFWLHCGDRHPESIRADLRDQAGTAACLEHRVLIVLDEVTSRDQLIAGADRRASILATSRIPKLGPKYREFHLDPAEASEVGVVEPDTPEGRLLDALHACRPSAIPLRLAAKIAGIFEEEIRPAAAALVAARRADPFDTPGKSIRVCHPRPASPARRAAHAEAVAEAIERWRLDSALAADSLPEAEAAIAWGFDHHWRLAIRLSHCLFSYLRARNRDDEARRVLERLAGAAESRGDDTARKDAEWELSWLASGSVPPEREKDPGQQLLLDFGF